jgi:hypothetical protein
MIVESFIEDEVVGTRQATKTVREDLRSLAKGNGAAHSPSVVPLYYAVFGRKRFSVCTEKL